MNFLHPSGPALWLARASSGQGGPRPAGGQRLVWPFRVQAPALSPGLHPTASRSPEPGRTRFSS